MESPSATFGEIQGSNEHYYPLSGVKREHVFLLCTHQRTLSRYLRVTPGRAIIALLWPPAAGYCLEAISGEGGENLDTLLELSINSNELFGS